MNGRIDYIDIIKGITIWGVVWFHTCHPDWLTALLVNSIFFFLSGIFFNRTAWKTFLQGKLYTMLVPFMFFYLLSYIFWLLVYVWDFHTISGFDWMMFRELYTFSTRTDYFSVNIVLWFIMCLFVINILYYFLSYLDKRIIAVVIILCFGLRKIFFSIPAPFMINAAFYYLGFFALGNLVGRPWIEKLKDIRFRKFSLGVSVLLFAALFIPIGGLDRWLYDICRHLKLLIFFFILMSCTSWFNEKRYLALIKFYGANSMIIMGLHILMLVICHRLYSSLGVYEETPLRGFVQSVIVMAMMYVVILFCNKYIPFLVGKKHVERVR